MDSQQNTRKLRDIYGPSRSHLGAMERAPTKTSSSSFHTVIIRYWDDEMPGNCDYLRKTGGSVQVSDEFTGGDGSVTDGKQGVRYRVEKIRIHHEATKWNIQPTEWERGEEFKSMK